jgi:hypothetical protein
MSPSVAALHHNANATVRVVTTPAATTSMLWTANFGGYEK